MQPTEKPRLRTEFRARRKLHSLEQREQARAQVSEHLLRRCTWSAVAAYVPMRTEPGSAELLQELTARGVRVIVPVVLPDRDLDWTNYSAGSASGSIRLGVDAIGAVDAVLVPALAVARDGTRLGRGGGSYDRALRRLRRQTPSIALLFDGELVDELPRDPWDVAVQSVVLPSGWQAVGESSDQLHS